MHRMTSIPTILIALVGLSACGSGAPAATAPETDSASPLSSQSGPATAMPSPATQLPTLVPAAPTPTVGPPTITPAASPTSMPTAPAPTARGWSETVAANAGPSARHDHSAVFDPVRQQLVVFGGRDSEAFGDTWIFDIATRMWREVPGAGPAPRFGHGAVYDAAKRRMLLVMGQGADFFNDVWAFDLERETWAELKANERSDAAPRPRYGQSAALDAQGRVLISHGFSDQGRFDDTWAFDLAAARWVNLTPASGPKPLKRCLHELVYQPAGDRLILFGGCSSGFGPCPQGDTWAFDLKTATWTELVPNGPAPAARSNTALVYDASAEQLLLFGGKTSDGANAESWAYDFANNAWVRLDGAGAPSPRSSQATGYDPQARRAWIFGGLTASGSSADLWEWGF